MAGRAELDARIARLEAALDATAKALDARRPDPEADAARERAEAALAEAEMRIASLEAALATAREARAAPGGSDGDDEVAALRAELAELHAAREMDLAEMKSLLAELEPLLEAADA